MDIDETEESYYEEQDEQNEIDDEAEDEEAVASVRYDITAFGMDIDVEGLVKRLDRGDILIPTFQREYVWRMPEASRFVESLLLGLPVPGVFLAQESETNKLLVIDGQQRLRSLQFFVHGYFNPTPDSKRNRVFRLTKVQSRFDGKTFDELDDSDRINLENTPIHATIIKQDSPSDGDTSIFHIFERLNSGGRRLTPQEIRVAVYHGEFVEFLKELNEDPAWREIFGKKNPRLKDQELILRFLAMLDNHEDYSSPMLEFLNVFAEKHRNPDPDYLESRRSIFRHTVEAFNNSIGRSAFRPVRAINAAVFESMAVGLATRIETSGPPSNSEIQRVHQDLLEDENYMHAVSKATAQESSVRTRIEMAIEEFQDAEE